MNGWRASTWGEEISLEYGKALRGYEFTNGKYRVFGSNGPVGWTDKALAKGPGIILGRKGAYRGVQYSEDDFFVIDTAYYVVPKTDLDMRWLYYAIKYHKLGEIDDGSPIPSTTRAAVYVRDFEVPPKEVQEGIARVLGAIDKKIDITSHINQTLEVMAQAIFKSWFVDFDPVKAKITAKQEGRDSLRAAMTAISGKSDAELDQMPREHYGQLAITAALFPEEMEESELGKIPTGWLVSQIGQVGEVICGKTPPKSNPEYFGIGIPFIKIPDMHNDVYVVNPSEQLTPLGAASQEKKTIPPGSICVSCIATVGKVVITHEPSQTNQQINSIIPKFPEHTSYLYFQMRDKAKEFHDLASGGSATLNMNTSTFSKVNVLLPSFKTVRKFSAFVEPLFSQILLKQKESSLLAEARDILLPKLVSGELSVADTMNEVEA